MPTITATLADDLYHSLAELGGLQGGKARYALELVLQAQTNGMTVRFGDDSQPATAAVGVDITAGSGNTWGPARDKEAAWRIDQVWVRNTTAGSNARVIGAVVLG